MVNMFKIMKISRMRNRSDVYMQYIQNSVTVLQQHANNSELNGLSAHTQHPCPHAGFIWKCYTVPS